MSDHTLASLRAETGFKLQPLQCGPNDDAFLGFLSFAFSENDMAKGFSDQFVADGGLLDTNNAGDIPAIAGKFIDWLIVNHWGEEPDQSQTRGATNE